MRGDERQPKVGDEWQEVGHRPDLVRRQRRKSGHNGCVRHGARRDCRVGGKQSKRARMQTQIDKKKGNDAALRQRQNQSISAKTDGVITEDEGVARM